MQSAVILCLSKTSERLLKYSLKACMLNPIARLIEVDSSVYIDSLYRCLNQLHHCLPAFLTFVRESGIAKLFFNANSQANSLHSSNDQPKYIWA